LPSAHIGFLDELFRSSSAILNSLLSLLNERTFNNGNQVIETPLQSIIAATNSWPQEESLQAFADRFLFRPTVEMLKKPVSKRTLDEWALGIEDRPQVGEFLTLSELKDIQEAARNVKVSEDFLDKFNSVWQMLSQRSITISDRRRVQILKFLRAWALVQGDEELYPEHMHNSLVHIVYNDLEDQSTIIEILEQEVPTAERLFADAKRAASGIMTEFSSLRTRQQQNNIGSLNDLVIHLRKYHKDMNTVRDKVDELLDGSRIRMSVAVRSKAVKLSQNLQNNCDTIAQALNEITH
jgi:MoxR-like ATPase